MALRLGRRARILGWDCLVAFGFGLVSLWCRFGFGRLATAAETQNETKTKPNLPQKIPSRGRYQPLRVPVSVISWPLQL